LKSDFFIALTQLAAERHLPKEEVLKAIEVALVSAFKKDNWGDGANVSVKLNPNTGEIRASTFKTVVEDVEDVLKEISLSEAKSMKDDANVGDHIEMESVTHQASRIAAQTAKQVVLQRLREAERELVYAEYAKKIDDIVSSVVGQAEPGRGLILELDRAEAILGIGEQVITERYRRGQRLKVYVVGVERSVRGPEILVSRTHKNLLKCLFETEIPEVYNGIVEIRSIAREAGSRSKVAVVATQDGVDPVGSCIGMRGNRIQNIVNELQGEKIDVVRWDRDLQRFISNALSPAEVVHIETNEAESSAVVVVPERQLSLAIGKEGQNARLAAKLTGWHLDIKSMAEWEMLKAQIKPEAMQAEDIPELTKEIDENQVETEDETTVTLSAEAKIDIEISEAAEAETTIEETIEGETSDEEDIGSEETADAVLEEALAEVFAQEEAETQMPEEDKESIGVLSIEQELVALGLEDKDDTQKPDEMESSSDMEVERMGADIWNIQQIGSDAGKIRFAEDLMGEYRDARGKRGGDDAKAGRKNKKGAKARKR
jgi:N utilization substance protein A